MDNYPCMGVVLVTVNAFGSRPFGESGSCLDRYTIYARMQSRAASYLIIYRITSY